MADFAILLNSLSSVNLLIPKPPKGSCCSIIFPFGEEILLSGIQKEGFIRFVMDPVMEINHVKDWKNFDEYLNALSSKYRLRANKFIEQPVI